MEPAVRPGLASVLACEKAPAPSKNVPDIPHFPHKRKFTVKKWGGGGGRERALPQAGAHWTSPPAGTRSCDLGAPAALLSLWRSSEPNVALPGAAPGLVPRQAPGLQKGLDNKTPSNKQHVGKEAWEGAAGRRK